MRISLVLPKLLDHPVGGYKVHLQLANALQRAGHAVTVILPLSSTNRPTGSELWRWARTRFGHQPALTWFPLEAEVQIVLPARLRASTLPAADVTILTAWQTAAVTTDPPAHAGRLVQVVYDVEFWNPESLDSPLSRALRRPDVTRIATSAVVAEMLETLGGRAAFTLRAGIDPSEFACSVDPAARAPVVGFALRPQPAKDMATMFEALQLLHEARPLVSVQCWGAAPGLLTPPFITRLGRLSATELQAAYNTCQLFLLSSRSEGFGLPVAEAMSCGTVPISTRCGGPEELIAEGRNGRLVPVGDAVGLSRATIELLDDRETRLRLAAAGIATQQRWTLEDSMEAYCRTVESLGT